MDKPSAMSGLYRSVLAILCLLCFSGGLFAIQISALAQNSDVLEEIIIEPLDGLEDFDLNDGEIGSDLPDISIEEVPVEQIPVERLPVEQLTINPPQENAPEGSEEVNAEDGTGPQPQQPATAGTDTETVDSVASELIAEQGRPLRYGLVSRDLKVAVERDYAPVTDYLSAQTDRDVDLVILPTWKALLDAMESGRIDAARMPSFAYLTARIRCDCVEPVVIPVSETGATGFRSLLLVRSGSDVETLADLSSRSVALTDRSSISGHFMPMRQLARSGVLVKKAVGGSFADILGALVSGEVDAVSGWALDQNGRSNLAGEGSLGWFLRDQGLTVDQFRLVWQSALVPFPPLVVRSAMNGNDRINLRQAFIDMNEIAPEIYDIVETHRTGGFRLARSEQFDPLKPLLQPDIRGTSAGSVEKSSLEDNDLRTGESGL
ncbi:phosphate/phosphite/phosphonate ABC transporter substrate-binding protein [Coralliovum pocilloporae]|uniref:phosphate/phosphite/phosphonate ABC transporter substrate-binding protein n=1 Tax=Coralliovum pocilloporae TaxID=3066369 RepID=UPI00330793D8